MSVAEIGGACDWETVRRVLSMLQHDPYIDHHDRAY